MRADRREWMMHLVGVGERAHRSPETDADPVDDRAAMFVGWVSTDRLIVIRDPEVR